MCLLFPALLILVNFIGPDSYRGTLVPHVLFELLFKRRKQQLKFSNYTILTNLIFYINDAELYLAL